MKLVATMTGAGLGSAVLLGVGLSLAHSSGIFEPASPDWLEVGQRTTVVVPEAPSIVAQPAAVPAPEAPAAPERIDLAAPAPAAPVTAPAPAAPTPPAALALAPATSLMPLARPTAVVAAPMIGPQAADPFALSGELPMQSRAKVEWPETDFAPADAGSVTFGPGRLATSTEPNPIDNVWLLGVYR